MRGNPTTMEFRPWADSPSSFFSIYPLQPSPEERGHANYFAIRESTSRPGAIGTARLLEASSPEEAAEKLRAAIWRIDDSAMGENLGVLAAGVFTAVFVSPAIIWSLSMYAVMLGGATVSTSLELGGLYATRLIDRGRTRRAVSAVLEYL